jgi:hypothetical protein
MSPEKPKPFFGRMVVSGQRKTYKSKHIVLEDIDTGTEYVIFPQQLIKLLQGKQFDGFWREIEKGGMRSIVFEGENPK